MRLFGANPRASVCCRHGWACELGRPMQVTQSHLDVVLLMFSVGFICIHTYIYMPSAPLPHTHGSVDHTLTRAVLPTVMCCMG